MSADREREIRERAEDLAVHLRLEWLDEKEQEKAARTIEELLARGTVLADALAVCRARNEELEREWEAELTRCAERINAGWVERYNRQWKPVEARNETLETENARLKEDLNERA